MFQVSMFQVSLLFVIIIIILIFGFLIYQNTNSFQETFQSNKIPQVIIQTYHTKSKIPHKVYKNIKSFGKGYKHIIFDDSECSAYILKYFGEKYLNKFQEFRTGAHKADFFRYCYLYNEGGIYLDIKTELIKPLDEIFNKNVETYTVLSKNPNQIYQGVIATVPKNPFFKKLIHHMMTIEFRNIKYHSFVEYFHKLLTSEQNDDVTSGYNKIYKKDWYLFQEICFTKTDEESSMCKDGIDRYGYCCFITDNQKQIIKTRYADYPWN